MSPLSSYPPPLVFDYEETLVDSISTLPSSLSTYAPLQDYVSQLAYCNVAPEYGPRHADTRGYWAQYGSNISGMSTESSAPLWSCSQVDVANYTVDAATYPSIPSNISDNSSFITSQTFGSSCGISSSAYLEPPIDYTLMQHCSSLPLQSSEQTGRYAGCGEIDICSGMYPVPDRMSIPLTPSADLPLQHCYASGHGQFHVNWTMEDLSNYSEGGVSEGMSSEVHRGDNHHPRSPTQQDSESQHTVGAGLPSIRLYQPPGCPYSYPHFPPPDSTCETPPGPDSACELSVDSSSSMHPAQRVQDIHFSPLLNDTCSSKLYDKPSGRLMSKLKPACFFCRKRKIRCQTPPLSSRDRSCNQCRKRKRECVYPTTSHRGRRPLINYNFDA